KKCCVPGCIESRGQEIGFQNQLKNYLTCGWRGSNLIIMNNSQGDKFIIGFMCATNMLPLIAFYLEAVKGWCRMLCHRC
ncbi:unnamed protein product, partial [Callosobruchus maculatus]